MTTTGTVDHPANYMESTILRDDLQKILDDHTSTAKTVVDGWLDKGVDTLFLVGCGGSLAVLKPVKWILDRYSPWPVDVYSGWEMLTRAPRRLDARAGLVLASHSGTTDEILEAGSFGREREANIATFSLNDTRLSEFSENPFTYESLAANLSKLLLGYMLAAEIVSRVGEEGEGVQLWKTLQALPSKLHEAKEAARGWGRELAKAHVETPGFYMVGTGLLEGLAYQFAICNLLEMQWKHASVINAAEFAHGPLEIVDEGLPMIFLLSGDVGRPVTERALEFSRRHGAEAIVVDTEDYGDFDPLVAPFVAHLPLQWFNWYLGVERERPISTRRYMGKVPY